MTSVTAALQAPVLVARGRYAGFRIRFLAFLIDLQILVGICAFTALLIVLVSRFVVSTTYAEQAELTLAKYASAALIAGYLIFFWTRTGVTPGKKLMKLRVVLADDANGRQGIGAERALIRLVGYVLSLALAGLPLLMIRLTERKQALHDYLAGTVVVKQ